MPKELRKTTVLIILDGWGVATDPKAVSAITSETAPHFFSWCKQFPYTELAASGEAVGLFKGQEGNSEAGHLNLGAGRTVKQDALYISEAIADGTFLKNPAFLQAVHHVQKNNSAVHIVGLLSNHNSAHSTPEHLYTLLELLNKEKVEKVFLHLFTDGRDSGEHDALNHWKKLQEHLPRSVRLATVMGRFYGMDRNKMWDRTRQAYEAMVNGASAHATSSFEEAIAQAYNRGETDEFIAPTIILEADGGPVGKIQDNDAVICFNLRSDRARQLTKSLVQSTFNELNPGSFTRLALPRNVLFVAMTDFGPDLSGVVTAFPSRDVVQSLAQVLGDEPQLFVAESEKFAHITYFFNGGYAAHPPATEWIKIPSDQAAHFSECPAMKAREIAEVLVAQIQSKKYSFIAANFANADMLGHTGDVEAAKVSVRALDKQLERIVKAVVATDGVLIITADHGNAEEMVNVSTGEIDTEHSVNPVPCLLIANRSRLNELGLGAKASLHPGSLADVAPTILKIMHINPPKEMTGKALF